LNKTLSPEASLFLLRRQKKEAQRKGDPGRFESPLKKVRPRRLGNSFVATAPRSNTPRLKTLVTHF
jgi:hypothetical protein